MINLIGKRVTTYDGHSGVVIKHFKPTGRDMTVHIKQVDERIWYCPETDIVKVENISVGIDFGIDKDKEVLSTGLSCEKDESMEQSKNNVLRGFDIEASAMILEKVILDNYVMVGGRVNILKVATRQILDFIEESKNINIKLKKKYKRRLKRIFESILKMKKEHGENPCKIYNYYGGWSMGYYEGLLAAYENILDDISFDLK